VEDVREDKEGRIMLNAINQYPEYMKIFSQGPFFSLKLLKRLGCLTALTVVSGRPTTQYIVTFSLEIEFFAHTVS
jgi:hypothetical protein